MTDLSRLITQVVQKARTIRADISKLQDLRFPSDNPRKLASLISNIAQCIEDEILRRRTSPPAAVEDFSTDVKLSIHALHVLEAHLRYIERATTPQTPWSLVQPLEKIAQQLHPGCCFVIRPQWHYNYSLLELITFYSKAFSGSQFLKDRLNEALSLALPNSTKRLYVIAFPYIDRLNVLMHTLLGHELGHPIEEEYLNEEQKEYQEFIKTQKRHPPFVENMLQAILQKLGIPSLEAIPLSQIEQVSRMFERVYTLRRRALEELICDLTAVNLFGPAALFAIEEFALSRNLDAIRIEPLEDHYPPWRYRLRVMLEELTPNWIQRFIKEGQFNESVSHNLNNKLDSIRALVEQDTDKQKINENSEASIAYESVEKTLPRIRGFVKERLRKQGICLDDLLGKVNAHLLKRLEDWIPPDAYVDSTGNEIIGDIRSILNIGWICYIRNYSAMPTDKGTKEIEEYFDKVDALNRLVLKAIEYADLRSIWHRKQQHGGD